MNEQQMRTRIAQLETECREHQAQRFSLADTIDRMSAQLAVKDNQISVLERGQYRALTVA